MDEAPEDISKDYDSVGAIAKLASSDRYSKVMQVDFPILVLSSSPFLRKLFAKSPFRE